MEDPDRLMLPDVVEVADRDDRSIGERVRPHGCYLVPRVRFLGYGAGKPEGFYDQKSFLPVNDALETSPRRAQRLRGSVSGALRTASY